MKYISVLGEKNVDEQNRFNYVLAQLTCDHWYIWYNKITCGGEDICLAVPFEAWKQYLHEYIEKGSKDSLVFLERQLMLIKTQENIRYDYFFARVAEAKLLYGVQDQDYQERRQDLFVFAEQTLAFLRKYYQPEILSEYMELLPSYGQAAVLIDKAFALETENPAEMLRILKAVVDYYPTFSEVIKNFLSLYGLEQKNKKHRQKEEMESLKQQVLGEVRKCAEAKQYKEAVSILKQLKKMYPKDLELVTLAMELRLELLKDV